MINRKDPKHGCLLFGCILSTLYSETPPYELPDEIVNEAALFIIGVIFAVNVKNSQEKYSPLGQTYDGLADLSIGITLILKNLISLAILRLKGVRPDSDDLKAEILPKIMEAFEKGTSVVLWIITSAYYPLMDSSNPETRASKTSTLFSLVVICLSIEFLHNLFTFYQILRFEGGPRCDDFCEGSGEWTICFSIFWTYIGSLRDRIAFLVLWIIILRHKGDDLSAARKEIDTSESLLALAKIAAIWYSVVHILLQLAGFYVAVLNCCKHKELRSCKSVLEILQLYAFSLTRYCAGVALCVYLYRNDKTSLYRSIGFAVAASAFKVVVGLAKLISALQKRCSGGE